MPQDGCADLKNLIEQRARHIANYLNALDPVERAVVWSRAEEIWHERAHKRQIPSSVERSENSEIIDQLSFGLLECFRELSPQSRKQVWAPAEQLLDEENRLKELLEDDPNKET